LFVGNPSRWKGADLLPALGEQLGEGFEILCLGGLRRGFAGTRLPPNVRLLPRVAAEHMPQVYHGADAALVPTRYEAFGYVALEAMACGLPVLGFASTGTAEVAVDGETALLAPQDDLAGLVAHARRLADDPALRQRLGAAGRRRAVACFDQPRGIDAYLALYRRVLDTRSDPRHAR
jgi:glycosyltransferase involved in cell wall biosynthesis